MKALVAIVALACGGGGATVPPGPVVQTQGGPVAGMVEGGMNVYRGIPYAAPPERWRPPSPPAPWSGTLDATRLAPLCPQSAGPAALGSEDCLSLDVFTPAGASGPLPVMVYVHGGGNKQGGPPADASPFVERGVVVVTPRFRLGELGFLALPALSAEGGGSSGNYALLDQLAALRWVADNIAAFGGDPANVTVFGTSSGSFDAAALAASPLADGLLAGAALETVVAMDVALETAESQGAAFATKVGCDAAPDLLACLRALPVETLVADPVYSSAQFGFLPIIDGEVLPAAPTARVARLLVGSNREEAASYFDLPHDLSEAQARALLVNELGAGADALYPIADYPSPHRALITGLTDELFTCPTRAFALSAAARGARVWRWLFTYSTDERGAYHSIQYPFLWQLWDASPSPDELVLSGALLDDWTRFAASGDPGGAWPPYDTAGERYQQLDVPIAAAAAYHVPQCAYLDMQPHL